MKEEQPHTESDIPKNVSDDEEEELEFQPPQDDTQPIAIFFCIGVTITIIIFVLLKIASVISKEYPVVFISQDEEAITINNKDFQSISDVESITSANVLLATLESTYQEMTLDDVKQENILKVQFLNQNHVQFKRTLRKIDYTNAKMQLQGLLDEPISRINDITYGQFLQALRKLQLTTLPPNDFSEQPRAVQLQQYNGFKQRWKLWSAQDSICSVLLLTETGLNTGNYYYAIRALFQQRYTNMKLIVVDNTPKLGLQAEVLGLIKQLSQGREVTIIDKKKGEGTEASSIYYALHKYCKDSQLTIILKDNGQIIGEYAFALLNQIHQKKKVPLVISHYLLDSGNLYTNLQNDFRYKVQMYPEYKDPGDPRRQSYKTKYLKSYKTQLLLSLPLSIFQTSNGFWLKEHMEVYLQFAALEKSCGKHYVLPQILYRVPKSQLEGIHTVSQARHSSKAICKDNKQGINTQSQFHKKYSQFESNLIPAEHIDQLTIEQAKELEKNLQMLDANRTKILKMMISNQQLRLDHTVSAVQSMSPLPKQAAKQAFQHLMTNSMPTFSKYRQKLAQAQPLSSSNIALQPEGKAYNQQTQKQTQFCIILQTHNNLKDFGFYYSIQSVLQQMYQSYRLIIIDNASADHTDRAIKWQVSSIEDSTKRRIFLYGGRSQRTKGQTLYFTTRQFCQTDDIIILMQAGEQFIGRFVLQRINQQYRKENLLAVYSNNIHYNQQSYSIGVSRQYGRETIQNQRFRESPLLFGSLRSFKAALFFQIAEEDFKWGGKWANDELFFNISYAILQIGCERVKYVNQILYRVKQQQKDYPILNQQSLSNPQEPQFKPQDSKSSHAISQSNAQQNAPSSNQRLINRFKAKYKCLSPKYLSQNP